MKKYVFTRNEKLALITDSELKTIEKYNNDLICCYDNSEISIYCDCADNETLILKLIAEKTNINKKEIIDNMHNIAGFFNYMFD